MVVASDCVGLTLPGMIEEPGSFSGMVISPRPERGPRPASARRWRSSSAPRRQLLQRARRADERIVPRPSPHTCWARDEGLAGELGDLGGNRLAHISDAR
jgi:hypothetical protein